MTVLRVKDLIALLSDCDPEGEVTLSLDETLVYGTGEPCDVSYAFTPQFACLFSSKAVDQATARPDRISIEISEADIRDLAKQRAAQALAQDAQPAADLSVVSDAPVAIAIAVSGETYGHLQVVVASCNASNKNSGGATTHGDLNVSTLLGMMAEDLAMTNYRPGSWEGANMQQVLDSHGYQ